jgi:hypothetical protein
MSKRYMFHLLLSLMILCNFWGANKALAQVEPVVPRDVSLVQLIANPSEYHGKFVRVIGFCRLEFEGDALYLHREDFEQGITKNAVWLDVGRSISMSSRDLSDGYVLVEGVFNAEDKGHMDLFSGCLREIKRIEHWRSRNELELLRRPSSQQ